MLKLQHHLNYSNKLWQLILFPRCLCVPFYHNLVFIFIWLPIADGSDCLFLKRWGFENSKPFAASYSTYHQAGQFNNILWNHKKNYVQLTFRVWLKRIQTRKYELLLGLPPCKRLFWLIYSVGSNESFTCVIWPIFPCKISFETSVVKFQDLI